MAVEGSTKAVVTALVANLGIAVSKFAASVITGSSSMLAEAVHSLADSTNQVLLLIGGKRSKRLATELHQFGYGRERYIYAFVVSIVLFTLGGVYAIYEGWHKISDPHPLTSPMVAVVVLVIAIGLESYALSTAIKESNKIRGTQSWWQTKSLLLGESGSVEDVSAIHAALIAEPGITKVIHLRTMHIGPEELMVAAKVVYLEPDIFRAPEAAP